MVNEQYLTRIQEIKTLTKNETTRKSFGSHGTSVYALLKYIETSQFPGQTETYGPSSSYQENDLFFYPFQGKFHAIPDDHFLTEFRAKKVSMGYARNNARVRRFHHLMGHGFDMSIYDNTYNFGDITQVLDMIEGIGYEETIQHNVPTEVASEWSMPFPEFMDLMMEIVPYKGVLFGLWWPTNNDVYHYGDDGDDLIINIKNKALSTFVNDLVFLSPYDKTLFMKLAGALK
jgi:hypothetical protein